MIKVFATGNIGNDAQLKEFGENNVLSFSIASTKKIKGENVTTWLSCSKWNSKGLLPYLLKGQRVELSGDLEIRKVEDKYYTSMNVYELEFGGKKEGNSDQSYASPDKNEERTENNQNADSNDDSDLPF